jgi:predicted nucleotidyltransferase
MNTVFVVQIEISHLPDKAGVSPLLYNRYMLSARDARIALKVKRRLSEITNVKRLVVYGSRARGKATRYSDLDLYIELNASVNPALRRKIREIAWEVSFDSGVVISTLVASDRLKGQPILKAIKAEGIPV